MFISVFAMLCLSVHAQEDIETPESFKSAADTFTDSISSYADSETAQKAAEILSSLNPGTIFNAFIDSILSGVKSFSKYFMYIIALILICAVFSSISGSFSGSAELFEFTGMIFLVMFTLAPTQRCVEYISECASKLCTFMTSFIPSMSTIYAAGGNTSAAVGNAVLCSGAITLLQLIGNRLVIPGAKICIGLTAVSSLCRRVNLSGVTSFIKSSCMWISGLIMTLLCGILSIQTQLQCKADTLAIRGVKFTASRFIPVAGGMVSESLKTVLAGVSFIRGAAGASAIAFIIYCIIPPIAALAAFKAICAVCSVCSKIAGLNTQSAYLDGINGALNLLLSVVLCCSVSFIIIISIFIKTAVEI